MNRLDIEGSKSTPRVVCDHERGEVLLRGYSYPENAVGFYQPLLDWLGAYLGDAQTGALQIDFELIYFNSSSSKILLDLFDLLDAAAAGGRVIRVHWLYHQDNESALECGQEFQEGIAHLAFELVARSS